MKNALSALSRLCIALALGCFIGVGTAGAALFGPATLIPDDRILVNFNNTGLDWVYAGPVAPGEFGTGEIEFPSFRAAEGWRSATTEEWALHPNWDDFIVPGNDVPATTWSDFTVYRAAPEYWSSFTHVDIQDFADGRVTDGVNGIISGVPETIYVRASASADIPEPATLALFGSSLITLFAVRRRTRTATKG